LSFVYGWWPFDGWVLPFGRSMARLDDGLEVIEVFYYSQLKIKKGPHYFPR